MDPDAPAPAAGKEEVELLVLPDSRKRILGQSVKEMAERISQQKFQAGRLASRNKPAASRQRYRPGTPTHVAQIPCETGHALSAP